MEANQQRIDQIEILKLEEVEYSMSWFFILNKNSV